MGMRQLHQLQLPTLRLHQLQLPTLRLHQLQLPTLRLHQLQLPTLRLLQLPTSQFMTFDSLSNRFCITAYDSVWSGLYMARHTLAVAIDGGF